MHNTHLGLILKIRSFINYNQGSEIIQKKTGKLRHHLEIEIRKIINPRNTDLLALKLKNIPSVSLLQRIDRVFRTTGEQMARSKMM